MEDRVMSRWRTLGALGLTAAAFALGWAAARPKAAADTFTADDYFEIQMLYGRYTHSIDHGGKDGMDYANTFVPDGVLVHVTPTASPCTRGEGWEAGTREIIRGSIADEKNIDVCIATLTGTQKLAAMAGAFATAGAAGTRQHRHVATNFLITPTADGATGTLYHNEFDVLTKPPTWTGSGVYNDTLVRTPNGWRFKKRVITQNAVFGGAKH
jgi:hypothetical protein